MPDAPLSTTIDSPQIDIAGLDAELATFVGSERLKALAKFGVRGELVFPVPYLLHANPFLLGYHRLLYGFSQKEFYMSGSAFAAFKHLEISGKIHANIDSDIPNLCRSLIETAALLMQEIDFWDRDLIRNLQLLTLGAQLRGSRNTELGKNATQSVYHHMVSLIDPHYIQSRDGKSLVINNDSDTIITIQFLADPDIAIRAPNDSVAPNRLAIEIKGGTDVSNIHNRLGEAEKSHQHARAAGYRDTWTIIAVNLGVADALSATPSTSKLFHLGAMIDMSHEEYSDFQQSFCDVLGITPRSV